MASPSLRTLGNICSGSALCTQAVADAGGIPAIVSFMNNSTVLSVKKECVWSLSNLAVGSSKHVQKLADAGAFRDVVKVLKGSGGDEGMQREVAYVLANPWSSNIGTEASTALLEQGVVHEMVEMLQPTTTEVALKVNASPVHFHVTVFLTSLNHTFFMLEHQPLLTALPCSH